VGALGKVRGSGAGGAEVVEVVEVVAAARTFSMSSQLVTMPCSIGYLSVRMPRLDWASSPTYESFWPMPTITPGWRGRPMIEGKTARGASSPAKPALHMPEPLSTTSAATSSSAMIV
jgi:hypothetical protein